MRMGRGMLAASSDVSHEFCPRACGSWGVSLGAQKERLVLPTCIWVVGHNPWSMVRTESMGPGILFTVDNEPCQYMYWLCVK